MLFFPSRWRMVTVGVVSAYWCSRSSPPYRSQSPSSFWPSWSRDRRKRLEFAAVGFGSALVVCGWYLIQNTVRYGQPLAQTDSSRYLAIDRRPRNDLRAVPRLRSGQSRGRAGAPPARGFILVSVGLESVPLVDAGEPGGHRRIRRGTLGVDPQESVPQSDGDILDYRFVGVVMCLGPRLPNGHLSRSLRLRRSHSNLWPGSSWA